MALTIGQILGMRSCRSGTVGALGGRIGMGLLLLPLLILATPTLAQDAVPNQPGTTRPVTARIPIELRVTTWNLAGSLPAKLARQFERATPVWRTSFGPRETKSAGPKLNPPKIDADVIALQSVTDMRIVRRLFPARRYHVIVSRQLLLNADRIKEQRATPDRNSGAGATSSPGAKNKKTLDTKRIVHNTIGTIAIAIRRASRIRLTRQEHLISFAGPSLRNRKLPYRAAALALHLSRGGDKIWILSLDLIEGCSAGRNAQSTQACATRNQQIKLLSSWLKSKRAKGEKVIVAGSFGRPLQYKAVPSQNPPGRQNIWAALNIGKADPANRKSIVVRTRGGVAPAAATKRVIRFPLPPVPNSAISPVSGQRLIGFPTKPLAGCAKNSPAMSDYILADRVTQGSDKAPSKGWSTPYPDARHCPISLVIAF